MTLMLPILDQSDDGWWSAALCAQVDLELPFPGKGGSTKEVKATCGRCEVREACLEDVMRLPQWQDRYGVWGGLTVREREKLRKQRGAA